MSALRQNQLEKDGTLTDQVLGAVLAEGSRVLGDHRVCAILGGHRVLCALVYGSYLASNRRLQVLDAIQNILVRLNQFLHRDVLVRPVSLATLTDLGQLALKIVELQLRIHTLAARVLRRKHFVVAQTVGQSRTLAVGLGTRSLRLLHNA